MRNLYPRQGEAIGNFPNTHSMLNHPSSVSQIAIRRSPTSASNKQQHHFRDRLWQNRGNDCIFLGKLFHFLQPLRHSLSAFFTLNLGIFLSCSRAYWQTLYAPSWRPWLLYSSQETFDLIMINFAPGYSSFTVGAFLRHFVEREALGTRLHRTLKQKP